MSNRKILALGADIKNRFLLAKDKSIYHGPEIGDLSDVTNYEIFKRSIARAVKRTMPDTIACDLHPNYFSTRFAKEYTQLSKVSCKLIQHHHAHIASVMQEHNLKTPVIGVAFDGTGFGTDGNIWGGEFLLVDRKGFKRLAHLKYRPMPGAEKVIHEPWRMALSIVGKKANSLLKGIDKKDKEIVLSMVEKNINSPLTSSAGRLFDAAAALLNICTVASYEAEGPIRLEALCDKVIEGLYESKVSGKDPYVIDTGPLFDGMLKDLKKGRDKRLIATRFHNSMAEVIVSMVKRLSRKYTIKNIALSGGVFYNRFLMHRVLEGFEKLDLNIFTNKEYNVGDLNIALGQYYVSCNTGKD